MVFGMSSTHGYHLPSQEMKVQMVLLVLFAFGNFDVQCIGCQRITTSCSGICGLKNFNDQEFVFTDTVFERFYSCSDHLHSPFA